VGRADPFTGYSIVLRTLLYGVVPLFGAWQFVRLRRALHIYQLESYKRGWFLRWCREDRTRALFLAPNRVEKKPLVMTGRAWRMLVTATALSILLILLPSAAAHLLGGAPYDLVTFGVMLGVSFIAVPWLLLAGDAVMSPVQRAINARFLRAARRKLDDVAPVVIGVTGSFGKTSTKVAIQQLVGPPGEVLATPGSFNTPLGVSRTINENMEPTHRFFVCEMGARQIGDIADLCRFVRPRIGVVTAIGPAHLETFGSLDNVGRAKWEMVESLPPDGVAVVNSDDLEVRRRAQAASGRTIVRYGIDPGGAPDVTARDVTIVERGTAFTVADTRTGGELPVRTRLLGKHAVGHVLAATAVALAAGRRLEDLAASIAAMEPVEHRLQLIAGAGGVTVIDDAYNSNPEGAAEALEVLRRLPGNKKVVVTPGMVELGEQQWAANEELGRRAAEAADVLIPVAKLNREALVAGAEGAATDCRVIPVDSLAAATEVLQGLLAPGDVVLFENDLPDQYES